MKTQVRLTQKNLGFAKPKNVEHISIRDNYHWSFIQMIAASKSTLILIGILMIATLFSTPVNAQTENTVATTNAIQETILKGMISDEDGPLLGVNILLKNTKIGTYSDKNGAFTFPKALNQGDVLVFSFMGYESKEIKIIENLTFLKVELTSDLVEILGALNTEQPYKSKRSN